MSVSDTQPSPVRSTYRHGDLRRALVDAGVALAREGGPGAVVLREVTRRAGVVLSRVDVKKHAQYGYADSGSYAGTYGKYFVN